MLCCVGRAAKESKKRMWKDYKPSSSMDIKDKSFTAIVRYLRAALHRFTVVPVV